MMCEVQQFSTFKVISSTASKNTNLLI